jgi:hypothetical protein
MRNYVNLAVPTMPLLVADKRGAAETKIIAAQRLYRSNDAVFLGVYPTWREITRGQGADTAATGAT